MARRGRKRRLGLEDEYWKLIADGVGTVAACKQLGIGRKTGYRWRAETGGLPPQRDSEQMHSMAALRSRRLGVRQIATQIGRSASTVSRELRRGRAGHDQGGARSRSPDGCVTPTPSGSIGTCVTRRSTRRCTPAAAV
jgi:IS30 family transposase